MADFFEFLVLLVPVLLAFTILAAIADFIAWRQNENSSNRD